MKKTLNELAEFFAPHSDKIYVTGGWAKVYAARRHGFSVENTDDIDLVARLPIEVLVEMGGKFIDPASGFPVVTFQHPVLGKLDVALPRTEVKSGRGYRGFEVFVDHTLPISLDLKRRDLTIGAIAVSIETGEIIDPYGGVDDLRDRVLTHVSNAFTADPLRVFRVNRFAAHGYSIAPETRRMISEADWTEDFANLPAERVGKEMMKAMSFSQPWRFFEVMVLETGVGEEFFPEIFAMTGVPAGPAKHHPEGDLFTHSIDVLKKVSTITTDPTARLAAFLHDIGKVATPQDLWPKHPGHDEKGGNIVVVLLQRLRATNSVIKTCRAICELHMKGAKLREMRDSTKLDFAKRAMDAGVAGMLSDIVYADSNVTMESWANIIKVASMSATDLGISPEWFVGRSGGDIKSFVMQKRIERLTSGACG